MVIIGLIVVVYSFFASIVYLVTPLFNDRLRRNFEELFKELEKVHAPIMLIAGFFAIMVLGDIARFEMSPFFWKAASREYYDHGFIDGAFVFFWVATCNLWFFVVPAHIAANRMKASNKERPIYPYVINALVGILLVTPESPLYDFLRNIMEMEHRPLDDF